MAEIPKKYRYKNTFSTDIIKLKPNYIYNDK